MAITVEEMLKTSQAQLDELFTQSPAGDIPQGEAKGTAIVAPGTTYTQDIANFINHFAWQGKVFDPQKGVLRNRITPFGLDRKSTRLNSSHRCISYAVFCLKKKKRHSEYPP